MSKRKGELDFLWMHQFKCSNQEFLLNYIYEENELI
ncbi:TPA: hypothetical protein F8R87_08700 [Legionella pneumophila]|nr:hypothetical protein [Legionella pneumophila]